MSKLTHIDERGEARMVDVGAKAVTRREAVAEAWIRMKSGTIELLERGQVPKGNVFATARIAGIMAAKQTSVLIPMAHPLQLSHVDIEIQVVDRERLRLEATVRCEGRTGVEMEALTAASIAALTVYDMCKAVDRDMTIESIGLLSKTGGAGGEWRRDATG